MTVTPRIPVAVHFMTETNNDSVSECRYIIFRQMMIDKSRTFRQLS